MAYGLAHALRKKGHSAVIFQITPPEDLDVIINFHTTCHPSHDALDLFWFQGGLDLPTLEKIAESDYDGILSASPIFSQFIPQAKSVYFPMAVDADKYKPVPPSVPYACDIIYIGNYLDFKPVELWEQYLLPLKNHKLRIFGNAWEKYPPLQDCWMGKIHPDKVPSAYSSARLTVNISSPFHRRWEMPLSRIFEASACGCPVISDVVPAGSPIVYSPGGRDLQEKVLDLIRDEEKLLELRREQREWTLQNHTFDSRVKTLLFFIENLE